MCSAQARPGRIDADGFLSLVDREKDMIVSGGFNVYPADIEAVLDARPDVSEADVIGIPSGECCESPLALMVRRSDASSDAAALLAWVDQRLGKIQRLVDLEYRDRLPRGALGKLLKRELREPYWSHVENRS